MGIFKGKKSITDTYEETSVKKRSRFGPLATLDFYTSWLAEFNEHDDLPDKSLSTGNFYYTAESIMTNNGIKKMFFIKELPYEMSRYFISDLRDEIERDIARYNIAHDSESNVSLNLVVDGTFFNLNLGDRRIKGVWNSFTRQYKRLEGELANRDISDALKSDRYQQNVVRKVQSFLHIQEAQERNASFYKTKLALEIVAKDDTLGRANDALKVAEQTLASFCLKYDIAFNRTFLDAHNYQRSYSPSASEDKTFIRKKYPGDVWSDDTISSFTIPEHGTVGDEYGTPFGIDIFSGEPVSFDMSKDSNAKTVLLAAGTGEGKSYMAKMNYTFTLPDKKYETIVFDYEGSEYLSLGFVADANIIGMGGTSGSYVNTMVIADPVGVDELDMEAKKNAIEMTTTVFNVLADPNTGMNVEQMAIFSDLLTRCYAKVGVGEQPETWGKSNDLNYFVIYDTLVQEFMLGSNTTAMENHGEKALKNFRNVLKPYFEENGIFSSWFQTPVSINEFMQNRHNIFNFGMGGKSEVLQDSRAVVLKQLFAAHLTLMKAARNRAKGIHTVVYLEELQRYLEQPFSGQIVKSFVSGGRKLGLINYLITNDPSGLVSGADIDSPLVRDNVSAIVSGITMMIIGALYQNDMDGLIDTFGLDKAEGYLQHLVNVKENNIVQGGYKHVFFIKYKGQSTLVKTVINPLLNELPLYTTDVNPNDTKLRTAEYMSESDIESNINAAFTSDGEWDKQGLSFKERGGATIDKVWLEEESSKHNFD